MRPRLLIVHRGLATFVQQDIEIAARLFDVDVLLARTRWDPAPWTLFLAVARADVVLCWFASWHAVLPLLLARVLRRPGVVIVGGYDVAAMPEISYGLQRGGVPQALSRLAMRSAVKVVPFSAAALRETRDNARVPERTITLIPLGIADAGPVPKGPRDIVLTVARIDAENLARKGLLDVARTARLLPCETVIVGEIADEQAAQTLREAAGPMLRLVGRLTPAELLSFQARAVAYLQLSRHEGFGLALAEAMRAGCVPVVSRAGSLPELVGDTGEYVATPQEAAAAVKRAANATYEQRVAIARHIRTAFPLERRAERLSDLLLSVLDREVGRLPR